MSGFEFGYTVTALYFSMQIESRSHNFDYFNILGYDLSFELDLFFGYSWCEGFIKTRIKGGIIFVESLIPFIRSWNKKFFMVILIQK